MTDRVHIRDADALERFADRLGQFEASVLAARRDVESDIKRTLDYLGERYQHWKRRYEAYRQEADRLWSQLERCAGDSLDRRAREVRLPKQCTRLLEQYEEAVRRRDEAYANMTICDSLYRNVQDAGEAFRMQAGKIEQMIGSEVSADKTSLKSRAARARALAAHRFSGRALVHRAPIGSAIGDMSPLGGTQASPTAQWTVVFGAGGFGQLPPPEGVHETDGGEGSSKEGEPDPEGAEGPLRLQEMPRNELEPPIEWKPGGERK